MRAFIHREYFPLINMLEVGQKYNRPLEHCQSFCFAISHFLVLMGDWAANWAFFVSAKGYNLRLVQPSSVADIWKMSYHHDRDSWQGISRAQSPNLQTTLKIMTRRMKRENRSKPCLRSEFSKQNSESNSQLKLVLNKMFGLQDAHFVIPLTCAR